MAQQEYDKGLRRYEQARWSALLGLGAACLLGIGLAGVITRRIMRSLGAEPSAVRDVAQGIARGALNQRLAVAQGDQSSVMAFMHSMQRSLARVVGEVRALAQRSASAAREIKGLISEAATRSEQGTQQIEGTGRTLARMVDEIQRLSSLMARLDQSSGQDNEDIAELQLQVHELDRVAQQNAALVEEMAASSEQLKDQAGRLAQAVQVFQV